MPCADGFVTAWIICRDKAMRHPDRHGPLDAHFTDVGGERPAGLKLQRALTKQLEAGERDALDAAFRAPAG
jgi:hypothetical protein